MFECFRIFTVGLPGCVSKEYVGRQPAVQVLSVNRTYLVIRDVVRLKRVFEPSNTGTSYWEKKEFEYDDERILEYYSMVEQKKKNILVTYIKLVRWH